MSLFINRDTVAAKLENFSKLEVTLRNLKVKFNSQTTNAIIKQQRGEALRLLYQLRMALEKVYPPTDIAVLRKTGKMGDNQPALKIAPQKEKYDAHAHVFFQQRLQVLNKPQKILNQEKHLAKFEEEKIRQESEAKQYQKNQLEAHFKIKQEIRAASINKLQRNAGFMVEWQQKGVGDWKDNQTAKKNRERRDLEFEYKQAEQFNQLTMRKVDEANKEVHEGISNFEQTLKRKGINPHVNKDDAERAVSESFQNSPLKSTQKMQKLSQSLVSTRGGPQGANMGMTKMGGMTLTSTGLKAKDKKTITDKTRKERERRRRKMIVDQSKTHFDMDQKKRESQIVTRMNRQAKQETELGYEEFRTRQCRNVISENRKLRELRYEKRRELDQQNSNWREAEMLRSLEEQMNREVNVLKERDTEIRILRKQANREGRTGFASDLIDSILDIANQAYIHQQLCDKDEIGETNWHEWLQLFIDQMPINPQAMVKTKEEQKIDVEEEQLDAVDLIDNGVEDMNLKLDHMELVDYLQNKGQWPQTLITDFKLNLEHILTGQGDQPTGAGVPGAKGGAKAPAAKAQVEVIQLEEGDMEIPQTAPNNFALGDAIETVININFEERAKTKRPIIPHHLSLKVCLVGYQFAGKKTQAERLKATYGLQVLTMNDLVQEAINCFEMHPDPIENIQYNNDQIDEGQENIIVDNTSEPEVNLNDWNPEEDMRQCGIQISELLASGFEVTDTIYVQLFVAKLRMTFPYKTKKELHAELEGKVHRELAIQRKLEEIERELNGEVLIDHATGKRKKKRSTEMISIEKSILLKEQESLISIEQAGWVLVDFPTSFAQAKLLETALSGFVPKVEQDLIRREIEQSETSLLVQATEKEVPPIQLIRSGIDGVMWFECNLDNTLSRAVGRRFDQTNEKMYHIQLQQPLTTNAPLCERLVPMDEEFNSESTLIDRWVAFDAHSRSMETWLSQFGDADIDRCILSKIDANGNEDETFDQIKQTLDNIIQIKQDKENQLRNEIMSKIIEAEEAEKERVRRVREEEEEKRRLEEEGVHHEHKDETKKDMYKVEKPGATGEKIGPKAPSVDNIDNDIKPTLHKIWAKISQNYKNQMKSSFRAVRGQRERIIERFAHLQNEFLTFLHRPDSKQDKLDHFIKEFNDFSDQYPDLREDDHTKDELHQRVDILSDELWEIIEERKEQEIEERKKIMESGWIEYELGFQVSCAQQLMQSEVDRFKGSIQIIHDYYHIFEDKLIPETPPQMTTELVNEGEELPPVEVLQDGHDQFNIDHYTYPRLDKLFERALKAQVVPDVTQIQTGAQDKKGVQPKGKDPKKPAQEEEKAVEESIYVKEMKKAIKVEKSLLRFRLIQIRNWSLKRLKETREKCLKVYMKIEDWIHVATKTENDAVDEMCIVIKRAIEEEKKIQDELRIKFMDFCVDEKIMNYIEPPREKLPALEQLKPERFTIPQLTNLIDELSRLAQELGTNPSIQNKLVIDLLVRKHENSKSLGDESGLPEAWRTFTEYDFQTIVRNLDKYNHGTINWKQLATYICLLNSPIPTEKEGEAYQHELVAGGGKEGFIDEERFVNGKAWFDKFEYSQDREYSIPFPRVKYIKELLFKMHKEDKGGVMKVNMKKILSILRAKEVTMFKKSIRIYSDIMLQAIEK